MKLCKVCETARREEELEKVRNRVSARDVSELRWHNIPIHDIGPYDLRRILVEVNQRQNFGLGAETPLDIGD